MRRKKLTKIAAVSLVAALCVQTFSGCEKKEGKSSGSEDLYSVMEDARDLTTGNFEMTLGAELDSEKMEMVLSGVTTDESFDIDLALNMKTEDLTTKGTVTQLIYDDEHLYVNLADAMDFLNQVEEVGELSDLGIDQDYLDIYVGDIFEQTDASAAEEMAGMLTDILEGAAVATDKKAGAAKDGTLEFKDEQILDFAKNLMEEVKDNAEDIVDASIKSSQNIINYDKIFDHYGDLFEEYGIDVNEYKDALEEGAKEIEVTDGEKESMIQEIEDACDEAIASLEDADKDALKGSKLKVQASMDGKKDKRTYELNLEVLAASEDEEEVRIYLDYTFNEDKEASVKAPKESIDVEGILEIFGPMLKGMGSDFDPEVEYEAEPDAEKNTDFVNEDGSFTLSCLWTECSLGKVNFVAPAGYTADMDFSTADLLMLDGEDGNSLYVSIEEGTDFYENYDYKYAVENCENAPTGKISAPIGEMEYILDNSSSYYTIYGFVTIDEEHYAEIEYTVYSSSEPTDEKMISGLTEIAKGLSK